MCISGKYSKTKQNNYPSHKEVLYGARNIIDNKEVKKKHLMSLRELRNKCDYEESKFDKNEFVDKFKKRFDILDKAFESKVKEMMK